MCVGWCAAAIRLVRKQQYLKMKYGNINHCDSDILFKGKSLAKLCMVGFIGGLVAGALGLGGGAIYNPALLMMGVPPMVSSATGLYLVSFSTAASVFIYFLNGQLNILYALWLCLWAVFGTIVGLAGTKWFMRKFHRQSIIVWMLVVIFFISVIAIPVFGSISLQAKVESGVNIYSFNSLC